MHQSFLLKDCREDTGTGFLSGSIDFWTDSHRREQYGCFVVDMIAESYRMENGRELFMSRNTRERIDVSLFVTGRPELMNLKFPLNFERFERP